MAILDSINGLLTPQNLIIIGVLAIGLWIIYEFFLKGSGEKKLKPISRAEIERKNFIEKMSVNESTTYKWLFRQNKMLGKIKYLQGTEIDGQTPEEKIKMWEMVVEPNLTFIKWAIKNPFAKEMCLIINQTKCEFIGDEINIREYVTFDTYFGIFYDRSLKDLGTEYLKNMTLYKTDLENLASVYFVKAQEQSTFNPNYAHDVAMEQARTETELAKKKGKVSSI